MSYITVNFKHNGILYSINRSGFRSEEQFDEIARDMITSGDFSSALIKRYDLEGGYAQMITNAFRDGPGLAYMAMLIEEQDVTPHPNFWNYEVGRNVKFMLTPRTYTVKQKPKEVTPRQRVQMLLEELQTILNKYA